MVVIKDWPEKSGVYHPKYLEQIQANVALPIYRQETEWLIAKEKIEKGFETSINNNEPTTYEIFEAYHQGDKLAIKLIEKAKEILNGTIVFSSCLLAPDVIVLGGGLTNDVDLFLHPLQKMFKDSVPLNELKDTPIVKSSLDNDSVIYGALALGL